MRKSFFTQRYLLLQAECIRDRDSQLCRQHHRYFTSKFGIRVCLLDSRYCRIPGRQWYCHSGRHQMCIRDRCYPPHFMRECIPPNMHNPQRAKGFLDRRSKRLSFPQCFLRRKKCGRRRPPPRQGKANSPPEAASPPGESQLAAAAA